MPIRHDITFFLSFFFLKKSLSRSRILTEGVLGLSVSMLLQVFLQQIWPIFTFTQILFGLKHKKCVGLPEFFFFFFYTGYAIYLTGLNFNYKPKSVYKYQSLINQFELFIIVMSLCVLCDAIKLQAGYKLCVSNNY